MFSFIIYLYFINTFINWHLNYFLCIVYTYDINLLIFCQCSNQPLVYPKIDLPGRENSNPLLLSSLPIFPSKPYKPSLFLPFPVVFEIEEGAWEGLGMGCMEWMQLQKKKQGQTNFFEIHLTLLHIFMFFFTRTLGWVWVGREQLLFKLYIRIYILCLFKFYFLYIS